MVPSTAATVPEYVASLPPERRMVVAAIRRSVRRHEASRARSLP